MDSISLARHARQHFLVELENRLSLGEISCAEFTSLCLIPNLANSCAQFQKSILVKDPVSNPPVIEFLRNYSWKGYTDRIRRSLYQWHQGKYPLVLWNTIPTPLELLKLQAEGKRVITVFNRAEDWEQKHLGKDVFEFIVHDLIHADHFFENSTWQAGQIEFYQFILSRWDHEIVMKARTYCPDQFDYLISDMNSHPQHMYQTLSALCLMSWKKSFNLEMKERLPAIEENKFQEQMGYFLETRLLK